MKTLDQMLEELNDSDVTCNLGDLKKSVESLETVEDARDFMGELNEAIKGAEELVKNLKALRDAVKG